MPIDFYYLAVSPPCRAVHMVAEALGVSVNIKPLDLHGKKEHLEPAFIKINPQHCVPTIVDGDFALWESRPIMSYLVDQYSKTDSLYPKDPTTRGKIDHLLYFDLGTLYSSIYKLFFSVMVEGKKAENNQLEKIYEALSYLEHFLDGHLFAVGNRITIADYSLVATVSFMDTLNINLQKYPKVSSWFNRCAQQIPSYDRINKEPCEKIREMTKGKFR